MTLLNRNAHNDKTMKVVMLMSLNHCGLVVDLLFGNLDAIIKHLHLKNITSILNTTHMHISWIGKCFNYNTLK